MLEIIPLFSGLAGAELARLEAMTVRRQIPRQSLLMSEGERADLAHDEALEHVEAEAAMASTAEGTVPKAVMSMTMVSG